MIPRPLLPEAVSWRRPGNPLRLDGNNHLEPAYEAVMRAATTRPANIN